MHPFSSTSSSSKITCMNELDFFLSDTILFPFNHKNQHITSKTNIIRLLKLGIKLLSHEPNMWILFLGGWKWWTMHSTTIIIIRHSKKRGFTVSFSLVRFIFYKYKIPLFKYPRKIGSFVFQNESFPPFISFMISLYKDWVENSPFFLNGHKKPILILTQIDGQLRRPNFTALLNDMFKGVELFLTNPQVIFKN